MDGVDTEPSKDMASTPCNTHVAVAAERSPFPCNNGASNRHRIPTMVEMGREPNTAESSLLRKGLASHRRAPEGVRYSNRGGQGKWKHPKPPRNRYAFIRRPVGLHKADYL
jgi:hypothetical protein